MTPLSFVSKYGLASIAGATLLTGCAGGGAVLRQPFDVAQGDKAGGTAKSWMSPDAKATDLIYISDSATYDVYVFSFPRGKLVGTLTGQNNPAGLCVGPKGDIFVTQLYGHQIVEYRHGEPSPIKTLSDPGYEPGACSVGQYSGDLAVANIVSNEFTQGNLLVYSKAKGNPITYSPPGSAGGSWFSVNDIGYGYTGNLYFAGTCSGAFCAGVLPKGSSNTENVTLNGESPKSPGTVQYDGGSSGDVAFDDQSDGTVYVYNFNGTSGDEVGSTTLSGSSGVNGSWILYVAYRKRKDVHVYVLAPQQNGADALLYTYQGGGLVKTFSGLTQPFGAAYSGLGHRTF